MSTDSTLPHVAFTLDERVVFVGVMLAKATDAVLGPDLDTAPEVLACGRDWMVAEQQLFVGCQRHAFIEKDSHVS